MLLDWISHSTLVVVLVAQLVTQRVQDIPNQDIGAHVLYVYRRVQSKSVAETVFSINIVQTSRILVLPDPEVAVDKGVVQEEDRIGRRGISVLHDRTNTIVSPSVSATLRAARHVGIVALVVTTVYDGCACVLRLATIAVSGEAVQVVI